MNKHIISGNISQELELRYSQDNKAILKFSIAVRRDFAKEGKQDTDFFNVVVFGKLAEVINKYFSKGQKILLSGRTQIDKVVKDEGNRYFTNFIADGFDFMNGNKDDSPKQESSVNGDDVDTPNKFNPFDSVKEKNDDPFSSASSVKIGDDELPF